MNLVMGRKKGEEREGSGSSSRPGEVTLPRAREENPGPFFPPAHLCGVAHLRLSEPELAKCRFTEALEVRERIEHPKVDETRSELDKLG